MSVRMLEGDAITRLSEVEAGSIDACVTDPPYGLKFMGKAWDHGVPGAPYWSEVLRVLKPGAHLLAFGGTVLDPFCGSGSTLVAADREGFDAIGIDSDPHAIEITRRRVTEDARMFAEVAG